MMRKFKRIDLTNATEDYFLKPGEEAYISFSNATSVPLRIATTDGTYYEMHVIPANTAGTSGSTFVAQYLYPNNTTYSEFYIAGIYRSGFAFATLYSTSPLPGFYIGAGYFGTTAYITNRMDYRVVISIPNSYGANGYHPLIMVSTIVWRNSTTPWTSLGTISYTSTSSPSGEILVRRLK